MNYRKSKIVHKISELRWGNPLFWSFDDTLLAFSLSLFLKHKSLLAFSLSLYLSVCESASCFFLIKFQRFHFSLVTQGGEHCTMVTVTGEGSLEEIPTVERYQGRPYHTNIQYPIYYRYDGHRWCNRSQQWVRVQYVVHDVVGNESSVT